MANNTATSNLPRSGFRYDETREKLTSDKLMFFVLTFLVLSILAQSAIILINSNMLPPEVPLFYSRPWGESVLASPVLLWILPAVTLVFGIINYVIAIYLQNKHYFLNRVLICFSALLSFAALYDLARIVKLLV